jgi:hypothetical protein
MYENPIEQAIREKLTGDAQRNALDFAAFLRKNEMLLTPNDDGTGWAIGGIVGNSMGYLMMNGADIFPGPWTMWLNYCDFDGADTTDNELQETAWAHASPCGKCHAGWEKCGGDDRTIFGKKFERLCHSPLMFHNPDAMTLESMQKLMSILKTKIK